MIILIRHATPNVDYTPCDYLRARHLIQEYDTTTDIALNEIEQFFTTPEYQTLTGIPIKKIFCSPLVRAQLTCQTVFRGREYSVNEHCLEAENEIGKIPFIRLKLRHWFLINRLKWWAGYSSDAIESKSAFLDRVYKAYLDIQAIEGNVAIVAHGIFLKYLKDKWLKNNSYVVIDRYKNGCFTVEILKKVIDA